MIVMDCFFTFVKQETNCFSSFIIQNEIGFFKDNKYSQSNFIVLKLMP